VILYAALVLLLDAEARALFGKGIARLKGRR
jgi:hypothetical protein